jgi:acetamidase/formamidase
MAFDPDLTKATTMAIQEMVDFIAVKWKMNKHQAYQLISVAGNVAVTQLVDKPNHGVHVRLPKSIFSGPAAAGGGAEQDIRAMEKR